jgi:hypothetical protein
MDIQILETWLGKRGITKDVITEFGIHTDGNRIIIPIVDHLGRHIFNKYRRSPLATDTDGKKYYYDYGHKAQLFGIHQVLTCNAPRVVITEGELDCLLLWSHNIPAVSSTGGAGTWNEEWFQLLENRELVLAYDNDEAGAKGMARLWNMRQDVGIVFVPDDVGIKDLTDYHERGFNVHNLIDTAQVLESIDAVEQDRRYRVARLERTFFHTAILHAEKKERRETYTPKKDVSGDIEKAKQCPITSITQMFKHGNSAKCPYHKEKTPSFTYFPKTNTCYCFGCNKFADAIDIYRLEHPTATFTETVAELKKRV